MKTRWTAGVLVVLVFGLITGFAQAATGLDGYPNRPIRIIVPFPPGGGVDISNRIVTSRLVEFVGQQIVIENRSGAAGNLGAEIAARATPDGYTLFACNVASHGVSPALLKKLPFNAEKDLLPISLYGTTPNVLVVHPAVPAKSVAEFIAHIKAGGGKIPYASPGIGTSPHMTMELFKMHTGITMVHVAYKGGAPALQDVMGGHVVGMFGNLAEQLPAIKAGRTRPLAVTSLKRNANLPDVPTVAESGLPGFEVYAWYGACAPKGVPNAILDKLNADILKTLALPEIKERFAQQSLDMKPTTRAEFAAWIRNEIAKWTKVVEAAKITVE
jgi:tripartite-type tricarboxylate transporter receptor subunit TctC